MSDRRLQRKKLRRPFNADPYDIFDPPSLDPDAGPRRVRETGPQRVVRGFGQEYPEDAPTVMAWDSNHLRREAGWLLGGTDTPPPVRRATPTPAGILVQKLEPRRRANKSRASEPVVPRPHEQPETPMWLVVTSLCLMTALIGTTVLYLLT